MYGIGVTERKTEMYNFCLEKVFEYDSGGSLNLIYCGKRLKCYNHKYSPHLLDNYIITFIDEGSAEFTINNQKISLHENCLYVMHPMSAMSYVTMPDKPWSISWVVAKGDSLGKILNSLGMTREHPYMYVENTEKIRQIMSGLFEKVGRKDFCSKMECLSLIYSMFSVISSEKNPERSVKYIDKATEYIHSHYCEKINVCSVADFMHMNSNYFSKLFKSRIGMTPMQYINSLRIERAIQLLCHTDMTIASIAASLGYTDPFYFSRIFKKMTGTSPGNFRKNKE